MPPVSWVLYRERVVARNSPKYLDVTNRPLRQLLEMQGWLPDDPNFEGIHHYPIGLYTDDIYEETAGGGIHLHHNTVIDGDVTLTGGAFQFTATNDFNVALAGFDYNIDGGDVHLTNGRFYGDIEIVTVINHLMVDRTGHYVTADPIQYALLEIGGGGKFESNSDWPAFIRSLQIGSTQRDSLSAPYPYTPVEIGGHGFLAYIPSGVGFGLDDTLLYYFSSNNSYFMRENGVDPVMLYSDPDRMLHFYETQAFHASSGVHHIVPFDGIWQWDDATEGGTGLTHIHKIIDYPETGWALGSGGSAKGGLNAGTATTAQVAAVVNGLVAALMSHHKLLQV